MAEIKTATKPVKSTDVGKSDI